MSKNILCIDDSKDTRYLIKQYLENEGYIVDEAIDDYEALNILEHIFCYDLLIVDLDMPKVDGINLIKKIRQQDKYKNVPILALTVDSINAKNYEVQKIGVGWIVKPFHPQCFLKVIEMMIKRD